MKYSEKIDLDQSQYGFVKAVKAGTTPLFESQQVTASPKFVSTRVFRENNSILAGTCLQLEARTLETPFRIPETRKIQTNIMRWGGLIYSYHLILNIFIKALGTITAFKAVSIQVLRLNPGWGHIIASSSNWWQTALLKFRSWWCVQHKSWCCFVCVNIWHMESLQIAHHNFVPYRNWIITYLDVLDNPFLLVGLRVCQCNWSRAKWA